MGVVAIIVMTVLGAGSYKSLLPEDLFAPALPAVSVEAVVEQMGEQVETDAQTDENIE